MPNYLTNQKGVFWFNGQKSDDFGIIISKVPSLNRPKRKFEVYSVPGRNGSIIEQYDCFEDITIEYEIWFADEYYKIADAQKQARAITSWLYSASGYCRLEDDFEPEYFRLAYFNGPMNIETELCRYGSTKIKFVCRPERFLKSGEEWLSFAKNGPRTLKNPTAFTAKPLVKITASGAGQVSGIVGEGHFLLAITDYLYIDAETQDVYRQSAENKNNKFTGTMPALLAGDNIINCSDLTGTISKIEIQPRWWTI